MCVFVYSPNGFTRAFSFGVFIRELLEARERQTNIRKCEIKMDCESTIPHVDAIIILYVGVRHVRYINRNIAKLRV